jgi:hypothetical protein
MSQPTALIAEFSGLMEDRAAFDAGAQRRGRFLAGLIILVAALAAAAPAAAQVVTGELVEQGGGAPIGGAFVFLVTPDGQRVAGTMTQGDGQFRLQPRRPGEYRLRAERIGYTTSDSEPLEVRASETVVYRFEVEVQPFTLDAIRVEAGDRQCRVRPEQGRAVARIWEEASKALRATSITEDEEELIYVARYRLQELAPRGLTVRWEEAGERVLVAAVPFVSVTPDAMVERGFVHPDGSDNVYYAPDAELLLSSAFLDTHCLRLARPPRDEPGWVGIEFEPVQGRDLPEIQGSVWLDAETAELRRLEYRYTGTLPVRLGRRHAGGMVAFERLATGAWIVRDWWVRVPRVTRDFRGERLHHYLLRGAEIVEVRDRDGHIILDASP